MELSFGFFLLIILIIILVSGFVEYRFFTNSIQQNIEEEDIGEAGQV